MILLIRKSAIQKQMKHASFKFHYDSINSELKEFNYYFAD